MKLDLEGLRKKIEAQELELAPQLEHLDKIARAVREAGHQVSDSWSGSCFGYHSGLYYRNFEKPPFEDRFSVEWGCLDGVPDGWRDRTAEEVKAEIERLSRASIEELEKVNADVIRQAKALRDEIAMELSPVHSYESFDRESATLVKLEGVKWDDEQKRRYVVNSVNACPNVTRDFGAITEGRRIPSHTFYEGVALAASAHVEELKTFWMDAKRLLKQIEARAETARPRLDRAKYEVKESGANSGTSSSATYVFHGDNARVNIGSADNSMNVTTKGANVFSDLRKHIEKNIAEDGDRAAILEKLDVLQKSRGSKSFSERYGEFIAEAANHMTIIAPFIPAITQFLVGK